MSVRNRAATLRVHRDQQWLAKILKAVDGEDCYLYCLDPVLPLSADHSRFFDPTMEITEDSATGIAAGPLAYQLVSRNIVEDGSTIMIGQGYEMKRASILQVEVDGKSMCRAGRGIKVIEGQLRSR